MFPVFWGLCFHWELGAGLHCWGLKFLWCPWVVGDLEVIGVLLPMPHLFASLPSGDLALPLGKHILPVTRENILRGKFIDLFSLLYWEPEKKDKEELDEWNKEKLKKYKVERT